jgi:hypothetical protein
MQVVVVEHYLPEDGRFMSGAMLEGLAEENGEYAKAVRGGNPSSVLSKDLSTPPTHFTRIVTRKAGSKRWSSQPLFSATSSCACEGREDTKVESQVEVIANKGWCLDEVLSIIWFLLGLA